MPELTKKPKFGAIDVGTRAVRVGEGGYKYLRLQNRLTNDDGTPNNATIYWGDAGTQPFEIVNQFTDWIPVEDVGDIYVRAVFPIDPNTGLPVGTSATVAFMASDRTA